jgi:2',3'-cyclic-nucleotide 2'-phosphodiesterase/3'-nucleotidase
MAAPDASRDVLIAYIRGRTAEPRPQRRHPQLAFAPVATKGAVVFHSAPGLLELARSRLAASPS